MIKLSVDNKTISVTKAVEKEVVEFLRSCPESNPDAQKRIEGWLKDFHIADTDTNAVTATVTLIRNLEKNEQASIDTEIASQAMRDIMMDFIEFVSALMKELKEDKQEEQEPIPQGEFLSIIEDENGRIKVEGNIHPLKVISIMFATISHLKNENKN